MEMNLPLEAQHFASTFTQGHKLVIPVSPAKYRPRPSKEPYLFKMMKVRKLDTSPPHKQAISTYGDRSWG